MSIHTEHELPNNSVGNERKRTYGAEHVIELDQRPFTIKADTANPFAKPPSFLPLCLIPRASLSLAYLDPPTKGHRLFSAHIQSLEAAAEYSLSSTLLIAQNEKDGRLYAVERVHKHTYALCRLRSDLSERALQGQQCLQAATCELEEQVTTCLENDGKSWWTQAAVPMPANVAKSDNIDSPRLTLMAKRSVAQQDQVGETSQDAHGHVSNTTEGAATSLTAHEHLQELAKQYLEALYIARTSLAYFAKGPLSRARAALPANNDADVQSMSLVAFLRETILTANLTDKKYRETVFEIVKNATPTTLQTPEEKPKAKRKRKWKPKRDKSGMFVDESEYVGRWWSNETVSGASNQDLDDALRNKASRLRSRETYLQVILVLEVLALESATAPNTIQTETPAEESQAGAETKKAKVKKPQDLQALLETLVERLCIWHSLDFSSPAAKKLDSHVNDDAASLSDELRNFCVEVIIPFYMSRIPKTAAMVNKRLGGPSAPAPSKRRQAAVSKAGQAATRQAPEKRARKPLARTPTDTFSKQARPPQLLRAATDLTTIKREGSVDIPLNSIPVNVDPIDAPPRKRVSVMDSLKARQVDFSAVSQVNDAKLRRKAEMQERVKEAVEAIRKPNRDLATQETAENVDTSFARATAPRGRIQKKREATTQRISIEATPKHPRAVKATPAGQRWLAKGLPSSGSSVIPASSMKEGKPGASLAPPPSTFAVPATGHRPRVGNAAEVEETPSRGFGKFLPQPLIQGAGTLAESPLATRRGLQDIQQTPVKPMRPLALSAATVDVDVLAAPGNSLRMVNQDNKAPQEHSVYAALGWDDDDYEELA